MKNAIRSISTWALCAILVIFGAFSIAAQSGMKPTADELSRFFNNAVPALMEEHHVVGAVVGITNGSQTLFLRGYGSADLETGTAVDPDKTLFRTGSVSKLFTWTAIMQLEEQGKLDLNDPIEKHLDFDIPDTFDQPIRIIDLMNHTPGFEDKLIGLMVQDEKRIKSIKEAASRNVLRRIRPPGTEVAYSNYGTLLAGYIVQLLSKMPYEEYVKQNILDPLGMHRSTFEQPLPSDLAKHLSAAYVYKKGQYIPQRFEIVNMVPAGAMTSTAPDMLRFYRAYLNEGQLNGARILKEESVTEMRRPSFRHDPRANGIAYGFFEVGHGDVSVLGHAGDTIFFHSISGYLPEEGFAYFISTNSVTGGPLAMKLQNQMFDEFFPVPTGSELTAQANLNPDLNEYVGYYTPNRRSESDFTKFFGAFSILKPKISVGGDGLFMISPFDPEGNVYFPVEKDIFQQKEGRMRMVFLRDDMGKVSSLYSHDVPVFLFNRPPGIETPAVTYSVLILGLLFILTGLIAPPIGLLTLIPKLRAQNGGPSMRVAQWSARAYLALLVLEGLLIVSLGNVIFAPVGPAHLIPFYLASAAMLLILVSAIQVWRKKHFRLIGRLYYSAFALSQGLLVAFLGYWGFFFV